MLPIFTPGATFGWLDQRIPPCEGVAALEGKVREEKPGAGLGKGQALLRRPRGTGQGGESPFLKSALWLSTRELQGTSGRVWGLFDCPG